MTMEAAHWQGSHRVDARDVGGRAHLFWTSESTVAYRAYLALGCLWYWPAPAHYAIHVPLAITHSRAQEIN